MNKVSELRAILGEYFKWHKSRLDCFSQVLIALFTVKTVNLCELAVAMVSTTQISSREKRLYRFFRHFEIDFIKLSSWLFKLFVTKDKKIYLAIDRTNWFWGKRPINIFMLSICFEGIAIPLLWRVLPKDGTEYIIKSDTPENGYALFDSYKFCGLDQEAYIEPRKKNRLFGLQGP